MKSIKIIYENKDILVLNKPAGLLVHSDGKNKEFTLVDWILERYPNIKNVGEINLINNKKIYRPGIVHRLDRDTSGIILIAKNQEYFLYLKSQFKEKKIEKTYHAFVYGSVKFDKKIINTAIGRSKKNFKCWATNRAIRGKSREAITEYKTIFRSSDYSYLEIYPKTGRTHQIRVHMKYDNYPIVGDYLYAGKKFSKNNPEKNLNFNTQALHAYKIKFKDKNNEIMEFIAELPEKFKISKKKISIKL